MMASVVVRHRCSVTSSASGRHNDRFTDPIHGLESLDSGPLLLPVEPAGVLDPKGGGCAVSWHGCACEVDGVVSVGPGGRGAARGQSAHERGGDNGACPGARQGGGSVGRGRHISAADADKIAAKPPEYLQPVFRFARLYGTRRGQLARTQRRFVDLTRELIEWPAARRASAKLSLPPEQGARWPVW